MAEDRELVVASLGELKRVLERLDATLSGLTPGNRGEGPLAEGYSQEGNPGRTELEIGLSKRRIMQAKAERDLKIQYSKETFGYMSSFMKSLYSLTGSHNRRLFTLLKAFNMAQALMDTYTAFNRTLASLPYPFNLAAAAAVMAQGLARVQQIRATTPGGGGGGGGSGISRGGGSIHAGLSGGARPASPQAGSPQITIQINNPLTGTDGEWERLVEERIAPAIKRAVERNVEVI